MSEMRSTKRRTSFVSSRPPLKANRYRFFGRFADRENPTMTYARFKRGSGTRMQVLSNDAVAW